MIVKAEIHLLHGPIHNFAELQTDMGYTSCRVYYMHGINAQFPFFWTSMFLWDNGTNRNSGNNAQGTFLGLTSEAFGKHA